MTPHEKALILKVADEVRTADRASVDREAEQLIRAEVASQPHAAYILTQRVIVQDLALQQARAKIDELEAQLRQAGLPPGSAPTREGGSGAAPAAQPPSAGSGVGDFLRTAAAAAAGTIGGQLIYDGLRHWAAGQGAGAIGPGFLGGSSGGGFAPTQTGGEDYRGGGDFDADTADRGGGGDFGDDQDEVEEVEEGSDDTQEEDYDGGGDWGDDGADSGGGGGDW